MISTIDRAHRVLCWVARSDGADRVWAIRAPAIRETLVLARLEYISIGAAL